tara:strand:+ start:253 stop:570 length:318 start_codon:yes stop_codon:yes gene_type:complete
MKKLEFNPNNWNWYAYLDADKEVHIEHYQKATDLSRCWVTCACGQLCKVLPKDNFTNAPIDKILFDLGVSFQDSIIYNNFSKGKLILDEIEQRTFYLLTLPNYTE